jgi:hypothetical protein
MSIEPVQTRIPSFLWSALQDVFYEQDVAFLKTLAPHIGVPLAELRRTLLGARGQLTTIHVGNTDSWWETEHCPLRIRNSRGVWRCCGHYREGHGFCREHRDFWEPSSTLKHKDDPWFAQVTHRTPWRYNGEIVWVSTAGDAIRENGTPIEGIRIKNGVISHISD